ncbi:unnamed protein product [Vitrella brassicaformis CCMP3155]|uniref:MalT-like TPR region domain-containing protein n=2 Tax=Vitrella brassicaformis TaxID=1169539 RepID=A0A0G4ETY4_VITBC|nr:unnamed protein product [Vitrella brassicaformis CCMP3155]|mmetsp:Transcript_49447/g.124015  ORF Transcript_49447/g.124015 Transcript_49447/m.124015 type:complete len:456 (+) Transcript_49447:75-1442(+)|eukprot:CEM02087.1 unnamed protein product [Vitrella brassicaformis CCMP3155]
MATLSSIQTQSDPLFSSPPQAAAASVNRHSSLPSLSPSRRPPQAPPLASRKTRALHSQAHPLALLEDARSGFLGKLETGSRDFRALDAAVHPMVNEPQRAQTPWNYNNPFRRSELEKRVEGPRAATKSVSPPKSPDGQTPYIRRIRKRAQDRFHGGLRSARNQLADLKMLAETAKRGGRLEAAGQAYYKMGVVLDNEGSYDQAINSYTDFLNVATAEGDKQAQALAHNCLGICYYRMGDYDNAITHYNKHLQLADDPGKFIAHSNLGIVFQNMGLAEHAAIHHQHAIEYAHRLQSKTAQAVAVGNLGLSSFTQGDYNTSRVCLQYHLKSTGAPQQPLVTALMPYRPIRTLSPPPTVAPPNPKHQTQMAAHTQLGRVLCQEGKLESAADHFHRALELGKEVKDKEAVHEIKSSIGVVLGRVNFDEYRQRLLSQVLDLKEDRRNSHGNDRRLPALML